MRDYLASATNVVDHSETVLTTNASFRGTLKCDGPVRIYGQVEGEIETSGPLIIGKTAHVMANIVAHEVGVAGVVIGNIHALGRVEIYPGGRVYGDIVSRGLRIEDGGIFSGQSRVREEDPEPLIIQPALADLAAPRQLRSGARTADSDTYMARTSV